MTLLTFRPNGAGDEENITYASPHWSRLNDDSDATYIYEFGTTYKRDLYQCENSEVSGTISSVTFYIRMRGSGDTYIAYAKPAIKIGSTVYDGNVVSVANSAVWVNKTQVYTTSPATGVAWTMDEINAMQIGLSLNTNSVSYVSVVSDIWIVVDVDVVMTQCFFPVDTPTQIFYTTAAIWTDIDVSAYVPVGATGVLLIAHNPHPTNYIQVGFRKKGSTDNRINGVSNYTHVSVGVGIDSNRKFQIKTGVGLGLMQVFIAGYTTIGVTWLTNAIDVSPGVAGAWQDADCSATAPVGTLGVMIEQDHDNSLRTVGVRCNGSTDNRIQRCYGRNFWTSIIGCDANRVVEVYRDYAGVRYYLNGYITDGAVFNTNATDVSLTTAGSYEKVPSITHMSMAFIEVITTSETRYNYSLSNLSGYGLYRWSYYHSNQFVSATSNQIFGKVENLGVDFFLAGYAYAGGTVYPEHSITRVTNIIHRYVRAKQIYSMECSLGEVTSDFGLPQWLSKPEVAVMPKADTPATIDNVKDEINKQAPPPFLTPTPIPDIFPSSDKITRPQPPLPRQKSLWENITPWDESKGETFGSEIIERVKNIPSSLWQGMTPWDESRGETVRDIWKAPFQALNPLSGLVAIGKRIQDVGSFIGRLFK